MHDNLSCVKEHNLKSVRVFTFQLCSDFINASRDFLFGRTDRSVKFEQPSL